MSVARRWSWAPALVVLAGCTTQVASEFPSASALPDTPRRPDAVAIDRHSELPTARDRATSEQPIVTLRAPLDDDLAMRVVTLFFDGIMREDTNALSALGMDSPRVDNLAGVSKQVSKPLTYLWRNRFRRHDFGRLRGRLIYRHSDVSTYRGGDSASLPLRARFSQRVPRTQPTDIVVHVPILTHTIKNERLIGSEMFFWLRRSGDAYRIVHMAEDLP